MRIKFVPGEPITQCIANIADDAADRNQRGLLEFPLYSLDEIGTDPNVAVNFDEPLTSYNGNSGTKFTTAVASLLSEIKSKAIRQLSEQDLERLARLEEGRSPVEWRSTLSDTSRKTVYPAKPLEGIWATAPYLHNGSVPDLTICCCRLRSDRSLFRWATSILMHSGWAIVRIC